MKKIRIVLTLVLALISGLTAQTHFKANLAFVQNNTETNSGVDSLNILAIMVQFQPDRYDATVGDGTFGTIYSEQTATRTDIIDPLPHNKNYFENHLKFVKNYYEKNSAGKLTVNYSVAGNVITLDSTMRVYSPEVGDDDYSGLVRMSEQAWNKFSDANPNFDFSKYNMFVIFHAGVGRDVSLPGSLGLERDLPSLYLSLATMKKYLGDNFIGIPVGNNFKITNTAILPETESREMATIVGTALYQVTINGLAVSMVGSYLGLPDLYNTETGYSAIGRFGLMDGQSIFAYAGAFPPAPSPIEKIWLGWVNPVEISLKSERINLSTYLTAINGDTTLLKIPINSSEYFLVENRERDANNNGAIVTFSSNGIEKTVVFSNDTTGFNNYEIDSLRGVITDIDESDWALPGKGIVIWHIDENVINGNWSTNTINNDKTHKGVAVVEADGINDIGEIFTTIFGDQIIGEGEQNDFWFSGNTGHYFTGEFSPSSKPSSNSYSGASSGVYISDFSSVSNKMNFNLEFHFNNFVLSKILTLPNNAKIDFVNSVSQIRGKYFTIQSGSDVYIFNSNAELIKTLSDFSTTPNLLLSTFSKYFIVGYVRDKIKYYIFDNSTSLLDSVAIPGVITTKLTAQSENSSRIEFGSEQNSKYYREDLFINVDGSTSVSSFPVDSKITQIISGEQKDVVITDSLVISEMLSNNALNTFIPKYEVLKAALTSYMDSDGSHAFLILLEKNNLFEVLDYSGLTKTTEFSVNTESVITDFSVSVLNDSRLPAINISYEGKSYFYNLNGVLADNSPLEDENETGFVGVASEFSLDNGSHTLINYTSDGRLFAFSPDEMNERLKPFYTVGEPLLHSPVIFNDYSTDSLQILVADNSNRLYLFKYSGIVDYYKGTWSGAYGNGSNNMYNPVRADLNTVFPTYSFNAYNWPNPVYGGVTHFRFKLNEDSDVKILIFDLSGTKVAELKGTGNANIDNEIDWDVSNVQSDVYFAHFEAIGKATHKTETKLIKVAVVK